MNKLEKLAKGILSEKEIDEIVDMCMPTDEQLDGVVNLILGEDDENNE